MIKNSLKFLLFVSTVLTGMTVGSYAKAAGIKITTETPPPWNGEQTFTGGNWESGDSGIYIEQTGLTAKVTANDNIYAINNNWRGLHAAIGDLTIENIGTDKTLHLTGNGERGLEAGFWNGYGSSATIKNMNINASNNGTIAGSFGAGVMASNGSSVILIGNNSGLNYLTANNNANTAGKGIGIIADGTKNGFTATVRIESMNIEASNNGHIGIAAISGGAINILGNGNNTLETKNNINTTEWFGGAGLRSEGENSSLNISGMEITVEDNGGAGVFTSNKGKVSITGTKAGGNSLLISGNNQSGIAGHGMWSYEEGSNINVKDMNITISDHAYGLFADNGAAIKISATSKSTLNINNNYRGILSHGLSGSLSSLVDINNMTVTITENSNHGILVESGGKVSFTSTTAGNKLQVDRSNDEGILILGTNGSVSSRLNIEDMNVYANNNGKTGIKAENGGKINISSTSGNNLLQVNGNVDGTGGNGLFVLGQSSGIYAALNIENMNVEVKNNGQNGINVQSGASLSIIGNGSHTLLVSENKSSDIGTRPYGTGIHTEGANTQVDITGMDVSVTDNGSTGIFVRDGSAVTITGTKTGGNILNVSENSFSAPDPGDRGRGIWAENGSELTILNMNVAVNENGAYGIYSNGGSTISITGNGSNVLELYDNNLYGLLVKDETSSININGMVVNGNAPTFGMMTIEAGGTFSFKGSSVTTRNGVLVHIWSSDVSLNKIVLDNSKAISLGSRLFNIDSLNAVIESTNSYLKNSIYTGDGSTSHMTMTGSEWVMMESSNITNFKVSSSKIDLRKSGGFNTLTLSSLLSNNSNYSINTYFNSIGDQSDKIIVDGGDATGVNNILHVTSTGYDGSHKTDGNGIQVINLDNATDKSVEFSLAGNVVDSGAYEYILYQADDDNYYLQSTDKATTIAKTIANMPAVHLSIIKTGMNELRKRMGELRDSTPENKDGLWIRSYAKTLKVDDAINSKLNLYGMEMGYDKQVYSTPDNTAYVGLMAGYLYTDNIKYRHNTPYNNNAHANTPSIGLYGTWLNQSGWFADATIRHFWSNMDVNNYDSQGDLIKYSPDRNFITASFELGWQLEYKLDEKNKIVFEPKAEIQYAHANDKTFKTGIGGDISYGDTESVNTRMAVKAGYSIKTKSDTVHEPFIEIGINKEWGSNTDMAYAGGRFKSQLDGTGYDLAIGLLSKINKKLSAFTDITYETGTVYEGIGGQIGLRYSW